MDTWIRRILHGLGVSFRMQVVLQFHGTDGLGGFGPACDSSSSDTAFSDIFSDNSGSDTVFSRDYRSLISVGGYALDDVHANPAVDSFELSLTTDSASFIHVDDSSADSVSEGVQFIIDQVRAYGFDVTMVATRSADRY